MSVIPLLPSNVLNQMRTLPKKLEYDYQLRVLARTQNRPIVDIYDTQNYILPLKSQVKEVSNNQYDDIYDNTDDMLDSDENILFSKLLLI